MKLSSIHTLQTNNKEKEGQEVEERVVRGLELRAEELRTSSLLLGCRLVLIAPVVETGLSE